MSSSTEHSQCQANYLFLGTRQTSLTSITSSNAQLLLKVPVLFIHSIYHSWESHFQATCALLHIGICTRAKKGGFLCTTEAWSLSLCLLHGSFIVG